MWLAVDCGNSRIKWATVSKEGAGSVQTCMPGRLSSLQKAAHSANEAWVSHVGQSVSRAELRAALHGCANIRFVKSAAKGGGVTSRYCPPDSLGTDRWLSLIAARTLRRDVVIVGAGTAITIDGLRADGVFVGGVILPGLHLSQEALCRGAGLPKVARNVQTGNSDVDHPPQSTHRAMSGGASLSAAGAAALFRRRFLPAAKFVLTGGDAEQIAPWFPKSAATMPNLPIAGLIRLQGGGA